MKTNIFTPLLLAAAAHAAILTTPIDVLASLPTGTSDPSTTAAPLAQRAPIEVVNPAISNAPDVTMQAPDMTTFYAPSVLPGGVTKYVEVIYSQTFAQVPEPGPTAQAGEIGLGTLKGGVGVVRADKNAAVGVRPIGGIKAGIWFWTVDMGFVVLMIVLG